ncbi:MAG TPA: tRNA pseudouridine(38-40) synthase TruA [Steroidobacteraceae bacterium]|jgi:tRNA pseudouridine38-40 synthase|nr:tRNA pseudouridine(38-40) synthase TruA [Steroidobacteraceae bacterium]
MRRIALQIEYDGGAYAGWQSQAVAPSVQSQLQAALARVADAPIALICAGRTDAGVHARAQIAHFDTSAPRSAAAWVLGTNRLLPSDISVGWARPMPAHFHARYSALWRTYRYLILNRRARSALAAGRALRVGAPLAVEHMRAGASWLLGEHDFSAFRAAECQSRSPVRVVRALTIERLGDWVSIDITANAFLHHMARNLVGLLVAIGQGRVPSEHARLRLTSRERDAHVVTVPAAGLYLWGVQYPAAFGLPADSAMMPAVSAPGPA